MVEKKYEHIEKILNINLIPGLLVTLWLIIYRLMPKDLSTNNSAKYLLQMLGIALLIGMLSSFILNLLIPIINNRPKAFQAALPSFLGYLIFSIINITLTSYFLHDFSYEHMWFDVLSLCWLHFPIGIMLALDVAVFGWLGAQLRTNIAERL